MGGNTSTAPTTLAPVTVPQWSRPVMGGNTQLGARRGRAACSGRNGAAR